MEGIFRDVAALAHGRRRFLQKLSLAGVAAMTGVPHALAETTPPAAPTDVDLLQFALNLEYLEAEFYTYAATGSGIDQLSDSTASSGGTGTGGTGSGGTGSGGTGSGGTGSGGTGSGGTGSGGTGSGGTGSGGTGTGGTGTVDTGPGSLIAGSGTPGPTTNGASPFLFNSPVKSAAEELAADEQAHVRLLRAAIRALGGTPIAKPAIDLGALGIGFGGERDFLIVARMLEDIGVSAYAALVPMIQDKTVMGGAAQILAAEAEHSGAIRLMVSQYSLTTTSIDGADVPPPPSGKSLFSLDSNGLVKTRTPEQVLFLAYGNTPDAMSGGFFPKGVNGTIQVSGK